MPEIWFAFTNHKTWAGSEKMCYIATWSSREENRQMLDDLQFFHESVLNNRAMKVSSIALRTLSNNKFNKVEIMPVTEDLLKLK